LLSFHEGSVTGRETKGADIVIFGRNQEGGEVTVDVTKGVPTQQFLDCAFIHEGGTGGRR
jgi:hypothetical protein